MTTWTTKWAPDGNLPQVLAFTKNDDGELSLSTLPKKVNGVIYNGGVVASDDALRVKKNDAEVPTGTYTAATPGNAATVSGDMLYATTKTNLVVVDDKGAVTTYTGYDKFPGDPNAKDFIVGAGKGKAEAIFYVTTQSVNNPKKTVTDIVVLGYEEQEEAQTILLAATGNWREVEGKDNENAKEWEFINGNGDTLYYQLDRNTSTNNDFYASGTNANPAANTAYEGKVGPDGFSGEAAPLYEVLQVTDTYIRVAPALGQPNAAADAEAQDLLVPKGGTVYYLNGVTPRELSPRFPVATITARVAKDVAAGINTAEEGSLVYIQHGTGPDASNLTALFVKNPNPGP